MTQHFLFAHWVARLRAPLLATLILLLASCDTTDTFTPPASEDPEVTDGTAEGIDAPSMAVSFAGGIPFGTYALPTGAFGTRFNGAHRNIWPEYLLSELAAIKARGGKVVLMFAGSEKYYKDSDGHFSLSKWKARIDRFRRTNFLSYVSDGTIIGHYLIDEPQDKDNWNGRPIPGSTVEEMARYSKAIWPSMATVARTEPGYLRTFSVSYRYLDAAWAQYTARRGDVYDYINKNVADAKAKGLALVTGLNLIHGGVPNLTSMSPTEVERFGTAILNNSYPCAFISWQYNSNLLSTSAMESAMDKLRRKAQYRTTKSCRS
jgi:hypothetical protein